MNFAIIGGDLRAVKLASILAGEGNIIYTYGLEKAEELKNNPNIIMCDKLNKAIKDDVEVVIGPIPFSSNGEEINTPFSDNKISIRELMHSLNAKILIAGSIAPNVYDMANDEYIEIIDIMKREELAVLNTISTAEGAIEIAIANTNKILHGSNVLILGFGRIGKVLARKLAGLSAKVTCAARKDEDLAWIKAYGHMATNINLLGENLSQYDIILNTVPHLILNQELLNYVKEDCLLIDLASNPGGIDKRTAKNRQLKLIWALALPGKVAPITTAEFIKAILFGIVEGITEWLPISSTGHMILLEQFVKLNVTPEFWKMFLVVIQLGAILAVVVLYFNKLNPFSMKKTKEEKRETWILWSKVLVACVPAAIIGLLFQDVIDQFLDNAFIVALMLIIYGIAFIIIESRNKKANITELKNLTYRTAVIIGIFQLLALIPGTSRSGATILGGILIGTSREIAAEFTFFLAIPVMFGASLLKLLKFGFVFTSQELIILIVGLVTAFIISILTIKFLMNYIKKNDFKAFGYYRIILGIIVLIYFAIV